MSKIQLKKISTVDFVLSADPAIGPGADYGRYLETGDEAHLHLTAVPIRLELRPLTSEEMSHAAQQIGISLGGISGVSIDMMLFRASARLAIAGIRDHDGGPVGLLQREGGRVVATWELVDSLDSSDCVNITSAAMKLAGLAVELPKS